ncbi:MAG TPA: EamA family transporter [Blastocatellia bacterium]|nr:EamA family transporter [Blastocatellia bacterium]
MMTSLLIGLVVLGGSAGDVFITKGMKQIGEISTLNVRHLLRIFVRAITNRYVLIGVFFMAVSYFSFLGALRIADLSLVLPATSISFVITTIGARLFLKETINATRWAGILLVCIGVALLSLPSQP